tara:strand:+ start:4009 stop:4392 length:384 start_codon:yes stop_codon:yes gene_type:complete
MWKNYHGLFDNGNPQITILETIELTSRDEAWKLRQLEQKISLNYDNLINVRSAYLNPDQKKEQRDASIQKYHNSPLGKLAIRKSVLNTKLKKIKGKTDSKSLGKQINNELKFLTEYKQELKDYHKVQ